MSKVNWQFNHQIEHDLGFVGDKLADIMGDFPEVKGIRFPIYGFNCVDVALVKNEEEIEGIRVDEGPYNVHFLHGQEYDDEMSRRKQEKEMPINENIEWRLPKEEFKHHDEILNRLKKIIKGTEEDDLGQFLFNIKNKKYIIVSYSQEKGFFIYDAPCFLGDCM